MLMSEEKKVYFIFFVDVGVAGSLKYIMLLA
jgi:hypothetical protein